MRKVRGAELTERQRYWLGQVEACAAAGKTIAEYALGRGIEAKAMYAGKKMLVKKGVLPRTRAPRFQRVGQGVRVLETTQYKRCQSTFP